MFHGRMALGWHSHASQKIIELGGQGAEYATLQNELLTVGEQLPLRSSVMIAAVEPGLCDRLSSDLQAAAEAVLTYDLWPEVVDQFHDGGNVVFLFPPDVALSAGSGAAPAGRVHVRGPRPIEGAIAVSAATPQRRGVAAGARSVGRPTTGRSPQGEGPAADASGPGDAPGHRGGPDHLANHPYTSVRRCGSTEERR